DSARGGACRENLVAGYTAGRIPRRTRTTPQRGSTFRQRGADTARSSAHRQHRAGLGRLLGRGWRVDADRTCAQRYQDDAAAAAIDSMITPRRTRLVRVEDLHAFRRAISTLATAVPPGPSCVVVVPTSGAARQLESSWGDRSAPKCI